MNGSNGTISTPSIVSPTDPTTRSTSPSSPLSTSYGPSTGPTIEQGIPNVGNLTTAAPVVQATVEWWAFLLTLLGGLIFGFLVGAGVIFACVIRHRQLSSKLTYGVPMTSANDKHKGRKKGGDSVEAISAKPNNALDSEVTVVCDTDMKGRRHGGKPSADSDDEGLACSPTMNMHNSPSDHSSSLGNKVADLSTPDSAVFLSQDPNLADSSSDNPESPVANWERDQFQSNISSGTLEKEFKFRHSSTSSTGVGHRDYHLSQGSYTSNFIGAIDPGSVPHSPPAFMRCASVGPFRPLPLSRLSRASSPGNSNVYPLVGSPVSASGRRIGLPRQPQSLQCAPDPQPNGHVPTQPHDRFDC